MTVFFILFNSCKRSVKIIGFRAQFDRTHFFMVSDAPDTRHRR